MTYEEIYQDLKGKTANLKIPKRKGIFNIAELTKLLAFLQISEQTLESVSYKEHEKEFSELFEDYYPRQLLHNGQYLAQLNRVLDHFRPKNPSPYKKLTQAVFLTARFFARYDSFDSFRKEVYLECKDDSQVLRYMEDFRKKCNLSGIYFVKSCIFFEKAGFFDIPLVTKKAKDYLLPLLGIEDSNELLFGKMKAIAAANHVSCHELNMRIEALGC